MENVAVVGLGAMGSRIALRLLDAGHHVLVWNRSPDKLAPLLTRGAVSAATPREAAARSRVLITMLADQRAVQAISEGPDGIAAGAHPGLAVIEMSTIGPPALHQLASLLGTETRLVDAPVLGSIREAESGALTIFTGGSAEAVDEVEPFLIPLGAVVRVGPLGAGAAAKLVANAALLGTLTLLGETLALADALELSRDAATAVLSATPLAEQSRRRLPLIETGEYQRRFALSLARKDADLVVDSSAAAAALPVLEAMRGWLVAAEAQGFGEVDYTAVLATILRKRTPIRAARATTPGPISKATADAFVWRKICQGWTLLDTPSLHIVQERMPPQTFELRHVHARTLQLYFVLEGRATIGCGDNQFHADPGQAIEIPPGIPHTMRNDWQKDLEFLVVSNGRPREDRQDLE